MKNIKMVLLPVALVAGIACAEQERVLKLAIALHDMADYCATAEWQDDEVVIPAEFEDIDDQTLPEILSAFDFKIDGKDAIARARSKKCRPCLNYAQALETIKEMHSVVQSLPETDGLTMKQIQQKVQSDQDFNEKMKVLMAPFEEGN